MQKLRRFADCLKAPIVLSSHPMRVAPFWLVLSCALVFAGCTPAARAPLDIAATAADRIARSPASRVEETLAQAKTIALTYGSDEMKGAITRLIEAESLVGQPGGVMVTIEPTRSVDSGGSVAERSRVIFLRPGFYSGVMGYNLVIDQTKVVREQISAAELALYLYSAELRREHFESFRTRNLRGTALLDAISTAPTGQSSAQLKSHDIAWEKTLEQGYRPWRQANIVPELKHFEELSNSQIACKRQPDYGRCWAGAVRGFLGL